ncbi:MAG: tetratricopeptide repeat protein, partial [Rivularia sp. (in: cyanobacteria)]
MGLDLYYRGLALAASGDYQLAIAYYTKAIEINPNYA